MSAPHDMHPDPLEDDPTGMRALLSSLPDPGPMPEDLVARITASLSAAQTSPVLDELGARRTRLARLPLRVAVAAAAAGVVIVGGSALLSTGLPASIVASVGAADSAGSAAPSLAPENGADQGARAAGVGTEHTVVLHSGTRYAAADLATAAGRLFHPGTLGKASVAGTDDAGGASSGVTSVAGARACATALGVPADERVVADIGTVDGAPAAVLLAESGTGTGTAYAVGLRCGAGGTDLIAGPVTLP